LLPLVLNAQEEPRLERLNASLKQDVFTLSALLQAGFRYSFKDDSFQGGRTFEAANARLGISGQLDNGFFYKILFNLVKEPNLLDAYIGYQVNDVLNIKAGVIKPFQTLDFIPDPGSTDFIDRAQITGLLIQSREIGVSAEGEIDRLYFFTGFFNGNRQFNSNNDNKFYGIGRIQYHFEEVFNGSLRVAIQGSHGYSNGVRSGITGPVLRGKRTIYGADLRWESERYIIASEFTEGLLETVYIPDDKEVITGYYITAGYKALEKTHFLLRWQSWAYKDRNIRDNQISFGINHTFTGAASFQFGFDSYFPENGDNQNGISLLLQMKF